MMRQSKVLAKGLALGQHSPVISWGSVLGRAPVRPTATIFRGLMPHPNGETGAYQLQDISAGSRHLCMLTTEGHLIMVGNNRYGQVGQPPSATGHYEDKPYFYDLGFAQGEEVPDRLASGTNFTIAYKKGGTAGVVIGNNSYGQLAVGHKHSMDNSRGFAEWSADMPWLRKHGGVDEVFCGYNHTFLKMMDGAILACGSNLLGELGLGNSVSPMQPEEMTFFSRKQGSLPPVKKIVGGAAFSLFLLEDGRVYSSGTSQDGQAERPDSVTGNMPQLCRITRTPGLVELGIQDKLKLVRVRDVACTQDMGWYLGRKGNQLFAKGIMGDYGVDMQAGYHIFDLPEEMGEVVRLVGGPSTLYLITANGAVYGMGGNSEGQIVRDPGKISFQPTLMIDEPKLVLPAPEQRTADPLDLRIAAGIGFGTILDNSGRYQIAGGAKPLVFPKPPKLPKKQRRMKF